MLYLTSCLPLLSLFAYYNTVFDIGIEQYVIRFSNLYSMWIVVLGRHTIFQTKTQAETTATLQLQPHWKQWFCILYSPYIVYFGWFAIFMIEKGSFCGVCFAIAEYFFLYHFYRYLALNDIAENDH